jgi:hypothetical protein
MRTSLRSLGLGLLLGLSSAACKKTEPAAAPASAPAIVPGKVKRPDTVETTIKPVYGTEGVKPQPAAEALCDALHLVPAENEGRCCQRPVTAGKLIREQCVRTLSQALSDGSVRVGDAAITACREALVAQHSSCAWIGGPWTPPMPEACLGLIDGTRAQGASCRSSLECGRGLFWRGAGASDVGTCEPPSGVGVSCGNAVDQLAVYTRQRRLERDRPECDGYCYKHKCRAFAAVGETCDTNVACGPSAHCQGGRCVAGAEIPLGQACLDGGCAAPGHCVQGVCIALGDEGAACKSGFECKAGCKLEPGAEVGVCGLQCRAAIFQPK